MKTLVTVACIFLGLAICAIAEHSIAENVEVNENEVKLSYMQCKILSTIIYSGSQREWGKTVFHAIQKFNNNYIQDNTEVKSCYIYLPTQIQQFANLNCKLDLLWDFFCMTFISSFCTYYILIMLCDYYCALIMLITSCYSWQQSS